MIFEKMASTIPGCFELLPRKMEDSRGSFVKTFHRNAFEEHALETGWQEEYYSVSHKRVLRGLHFQLPPHNHTKLVYCVSGVVLDAVVDLREGSPRYGQFALFNLDATKANMIYIPKGCAHGFYTLSDSATIVYKVSTVYSPDHDAGILWNSVSPIWPDPDPILSQRDRAFPPFASFVSPFQYDQSVQGRAAEGRHENDGDFNISQGSTIHGHAPFLVGNGEEP
ncbi:dTDP-4-dehydrorhamnose 3,5-epimerase family protein [Citrifermentans bremense]|nr:dTDP-4-dehydrorhamnose 3,5-epimerase family protein [Citrifermentans bremense]